MSVESLECGYYYGIVHVDDLYKLFKEYDVENHGDSFYVDTLIHCELLVEDDDILEYGKLVEIMKNLEVDKK